MARARRWMILAIPMAVLMVLVTMGAPLARGQELDVPHPAHIHAGTCGNLGDIVAPLNDVTELTAGESFGSAGAVLVKESETEVALPLGDILAEPHAINIHESADAIQNYIACGDIGGRVIDGDLAIGLLGLNLSNYQGVVVLEGDDDLTDVTVYLYNVGTGFPPKQDANAADAATDDAATDDTAADDAAATAAPVETPADAAQSADAPAAVEVPVDIRDFLYSPDPIEIAAGETVTWTNQDPVPHTATAEDRDVLQSGTISPGASFSQVFPEAGEFGYFCEFHPDMAGTIVVQ